MPAKARQVGGTALTVGQYSQLVLDRYLRGALDASDPQHNLAAAGQQLYELLGRLAGAASKDSEDAKAPLKAIRNTIDKHAFHSAQGADSPEVAALLQLYAELESICQDRIAAGGSECKMALQVQEQLQYRLMRLVLGDAWQARPQLKLRVLKLMFRFLSDENERILASSRGRVGVEPASPWEAAAGSTLRVQPRTGSFGRKAPPAAAVTVSHSRWGEAINELNRLQGSRMLPLLKLAIIENMQLSEALEAAIASPAGTAGSAALGGPGRGPLVAAGPAAGAGGHGQSAGADEAYGQLPGGEGKEEPLAGGSDGGSVKSTAGTGPRHAVPMALAAPTTPAAGGGLREAPQPSLSQQAQQAQAARREQGRGQQPGVAVGVDDLLGWDPLQVEQPHPLPPPGAPAHSPALEQLFEVFDNVGGPTAAGSSAAGSASWDQGGNPFAAAFPAAPTTESVRGQLSDMAIATPTRQPSVEQLPAVPYSNSLPSFGSMPQPPSPTPGYMPGPAANLGAYSAPGSRLGDSLERDTEAGGAGAAQLQRHYSSSREDRASTGLDVPSPYCGKPNPFGDTRFSDLAPQLQARRPAPPPPAPPAGPPMRSSSTK